MTAAAPSPTTAPSVNPAIARAVAFKRLITGSQREQIAAQLPKGIDVDRFVRTALTVVAMNPALLTCTSTSLLGSIMTAAKDGLLPDGKEALIQVYNCNVAPKGQPARWEKQAQYQPMVRGLINILYRTGEVTMIDGVAVRAKDDFEYERGSTPRIFHKPYIGAEDPGPVIAAYVVAKLTNGETKLEVMSAYDIAKVRALAKSDGAWAKWEDQFAIKAVIKRVFKQLPIESLALAQVLEHDNLTFDLDKAAPEPVKVDAQPGQPSRLKAIINHQAPQPAEEPAYFGEDLPLEECPAYDR